MLRLSGRVSDAVEAVVLGVDGEAMPQPWGLEAFEVRRQQSCPASPYALVIESEYQHWSLR